MLPHRNPASPVTDNGTWKERSYSRALLGPEVRWASGGLPESDIPCKSSCLFARRLMLLGVLEPGVDSRPIAACESRDFATKIKGFYKKGNISVLPPQHLTAKQESL